MTTEIPRDTEGMYPWPWAPEWAEFAAADEDGYMEFFLGEPDMGEAGYWFAQFGVVSSANCGEMRLRPEHRAIDWRTTLRRRPEE